MTSSTRSFFKLALCVLVAATSLSAQDWSQWRGPVRTGDAIRVSRAGGTWTTAEAWQNADVPMYMSTPVLAGDTLVGLTHRNRGQFFALDPKTGRTLWTSPGRQGENAALVASAGLVLVVTTDSQLVVFRTDPKTYTEVQRYTLAKTPVWAHPAPAGSGLLVKDRTTLSYWTF